MNTLKKYCLYILSILTSLLAARAGAQTWQYLGAQYSINVASDMSIGYSGSSPALYLAQKQGVAKKLTEGGVWSDLPHDYTASADLIACEPANPDVVYVGNG